MEELGEKITKGFVMKKLVIVIMMITATKSMGMVSISTSNCSKKFIAEVKTVKEAQAPLNVRSVDLVDLEVTSIEAGDVAKIEQVEVLTFSALKPKIGEQYKVELNGNKICQFEPLDEVHEH
jgi:hypothetical protein